MKNYYFTFGCGQAHPNGYVVIYGTLESTREKMFNRFNNQWSMQYTEEEFLPQIEKFNLHEVR